MPVETPPQKLRTLAASTRVLAWVDAIAQALPTPVLLLDVDGRLLNMNHAGHAELGRARVLMQRDGRVLPVDPSQRGSFAAALRLAANKQQRRLWAGDAWAAAVSITPLAAVPAAAAKTAPPRGDGATSAATASLLMLVFQPAPPTDESRRLFAAQHGLSPAEQQVLHALASGLSVQQLEWTRGVRQSTIRRQVLSLRRKCSEASLQALLARVNTLPPLGPTTPVPGSSTRAESPQLPSQGK